VNYCRFTALFEEPSVTYMPNFFFFFNIYS